MYHDPQDAAVIAMCDHCGGEIYVGETFYEPSDESVYVCTDCVKDWFWQRYADELLEVHHG